MNIIHVLWGRKKGTAEWEEEVLAETSDIKQLEAARIQALANGFIGLRVMHTFDGDKPNFG